ncbi:zinc ribbon domain-containing protein [Bombilactobacillus thymidiniphilus]|uniref:Zinc ribbon domain-containing protein n=1 Tax=Bombilactobacillus thymidiniphilus TaxID=2923363 RepID=A0ABY4PF04_9LACO|nr:zinc ribbon domain-containing protein [Bombilactobacillus thymidiniphilus]UQS84220.1 zinc ribbon domain-containing protein [Bombilactobacillus thymidiniphilus]
MHYCPNCGAKVAAGVKKCPHCDYQFQNPADRRRNVASDTNTAYSRSTRYHSDNSLWQFILWLKDNPVTLLLALILVILTGIYVGKIIMVILVITLLAVGYWHANKKQVSTDQKLRRIFGKNKTKTQAKHLHPRVKKTIDPSLSNQQFNYDQSMEAGRQTEVAQVVPTSKSVRSGQRSWVSFVVAALLISTSYWPHFFNVDLFAGVQAFNSDNSASLAQIMQRSILLLDSIFNLSIKPDLSLWIIAAGPILTLLGALMPNHFGRRLAIWGAVISVIFYLGGFLILKGILSFGSNMGVTPQLALGASGSVAVCGSIVLLAVTVWQAHRKH